MAKLRAYYQLIKPGIVYGNLVHVLAGVLFAWQYDLAAWPRIIGVLIGTACVIAAGCIVNNYLDREIDMRMARTKRRGFVSGEVSVPVAIFIAVVLLGGGIALLYWLTNVITMILGIVGFVSYSFVYTLSKRHTPLSTLVGTVPGSIPIVAGVTAVTGEMTTLAWLLGALLVAWQMVHFYAIALYRRDEYAAANLPVISVVKPFRRVAWSIVAYSVIYAFIVAIFFAVPLMHPVAVVVLTLGAVWQMKVAFDGLSSEARQTRWARSMFRTSLLLTLVLLVSAGLHGLLTWSNTLQ